MTINCLPILWPLHTVDKVRKKGQENVEDAGSSIVKIVLSRHFYVCLCLCLLYIIYYKEADVGLKKKREGTESKSD